MRRRRREARHRHELRLRRRPTPSGKAAGAGAWRRGRAPAACASSARTRRASPTSAPARWPSFSTMFIEVAPADGPVGIVSQSGAMSVIPYGLLRAARHRRAPLARDRQRLRRHGLRAGHAWSPRIPGCKLLLLYLESIPDPLAPGRGGADRARARPADRRAQVGAYRGRPGGGPLAHRRARQRGPRRRRLLRRARHLARRRTWPIWSTPRELYLKGWKPRGRRLVAISNSGAVCVLTADAASVGRHAAAAARGRDPGRAARRSCRASRRRPIRSTSPRRC